MSGWKKLTMMLAHATYGMLILIAGRNIIRGRAVAGIALAVH